VNGNCIYTPVVCTQNTDCGIDGFIGNNFCSNGDVYGLFVSYFCNNNQCSNSANNMLVQDCLYGCLNGICLQQPLQCVADSDCGSVSVERICIGTNIINRVTTPLCIGNNCTALVVDNLVQQCVYQCVNGNCITPPACTIDSDCGSSISQIVCSGNNVVNITVTPQCIGNSCTSNTNNVTVQTCNYQCINGVCINPPIICTQNSDCNDGDTRTVDECINPGSPSSFCRNTQVNCLTNSDCGITGFIDDNFCFGEDVYRLFQNATCQNPGTLQSNCIISQTPQLTNDCDDGNAQTIDNCNNGTCVHTLIQCLFDWQCDDLNGYTIDLCMFPGTVNSFCRHDAIICFTAADCNDGNPQTQDVCMNPGTVNSYCQHNGLQCINDGQCGQVSVQRMCIGNNVIDRTTTPLCIGNACTSTVVDVIVQTCAYQCVNGSCVNPPACIIDSDCGNLTSQLLCIGNNAVNRTTIPICLVNGCSTTTNDIITQSCTNGCFNGNCIIPPVTCYNDIDCTDGDARTVDECINAGTPNSYCRNTEVNCLLNSDCGITGFIDDNFCFGEDVYRLFQNATCQNPGTLQSNCIISQTPQLTNDCDDGNAQTIDNCNNGTCVHTLIQCLFDWQCDDLNGYTIDLCMFPGTVNSFCRHDAIICFTAADCNDGNPQTQDVCMNPGTVNSYCQHNGLQCINDGQCGQVSVQRMCIGNNVIDRTTTPLCIGNACTSTVVDVIVQTCAYQCVNGSCVNPPIACYTNLECSDGNIRTVDECINPGTVNSYCRSTEVNCLLDGDCGITGFIGNNFCLNNDVYRLFQTATCLSPGTLQSNCQITSENRLVQDCLYGCLNGACINNVYQCSDGLDNDGDSFIDWPADPGCTSSTDNSESPYNLPQCDDGLDNDGDGHVDYPSDSQCKSRMDNNEAVL
jgi:hypothetical protein